MPRLSLLAAALAGAIVAALPRAARAGDLDLERPWQLTFAGGPRFAQLAPFSHQYQNVLSAYGYGTMANFLEVSAEAGYSVVRKLDLGVHAAYLFGSAGSNGAGTMTLHTVELGGFLHVMFLRDDPKRTGGLGVGVEGGVEIPLLLLHGQIDHAAVPYVGPVIVAHMADWDAVQPAVHVRYLISNWGGALGGAGLPLGGLSITAGVNISL